MGEEEIIIDIDIGREASGEPIVAIVTESGKIFAISAKIKKCLDFKEKLVKHGVDSFVIMKKDAVIKQVFCGQGLDRVWFNREFEGEYKTFVIGNDKGKT